MRIFGYNITKDVPPGPQGNIHVVDPVGDKFDGFDRPQLVVRNLRPGMWVMSEGASWPRAGILVGLTSDGEARVALTQEDGTTLMEVRVRAITLKQATYEQIPAARKAQRPAAEFVAMGYRSVS